MGEIAINPLHNVHKQYRKMNLVNPYWFTAPAADFVSTWNTANTSAGSSTSTQVKLPLISAGTYNFVVQWGDGNSDTITVWNAAATTHTYASSGTYTVTITGVCTGWRFNNTLDRLKLLSIASWGTLKLGNLGGYFYGCSNLNLSATTDILDTTGTLLFDNTFLNCTALTTINGIGSWNMSAVTSLSGMLAVCPSFNQSLNGWTTSAVTNMTSVFSGSTIFNNGLASGVAGTLTWNTSACTTMITMFSGCAHFNQDVSGFTVNLVTNFQQTFNGCSKFNNGGSAGIGSWTLKTTGTVVLNSMFTNCIIFNQSLNGWNTVAVTSLGAIFSGCTAFNNGLASGVAGTLTWNTAACTTFLNTFSGCPNFNQDVSGFTVNLVTTFDSMFANCSKFTNGGNSAIGSWTLKTTGTVTLNNTFLNCVLFNHSLNGWNTVAVTQMSGTFSGATIFNNGLASGVAGTMSWNTAAVTFTSAMFSGCAHFNQDVSGFTMNLSGSMSQMFFNCVRFNNGGSSGIGSWTLKTTGTVDLSQIFRSASIFNQPLSWNTVAVTNMSYMFYAAGAFNQALAFNTLNVTTMFEMFDLATAFQQNLGAWDVRNVTNFSQFMASKTPATFPTTYLDNIYNGWSTLPSLKTPITITFGTAKYTAAATAGRLILTSAPYNWTITDGGI
jgi:surface protein